MLNEKQYCSYMIFKFFWKGKCFSDESGNSLPHCIIEPLDMTCFSAVFCDGTVTFWRKNSGICLPKICINNSALTIFRRERIPKSFCSFSAPAAGVKADNFFCYDINCKLYQILILFIPDIWPNFITFNYETSFSLSDRFNFFSICWYISST